MMLTSDLDAAEKVVEGNVADLVSLSLNALAKNIGIWSKVLKIETFMLQ